MSIAAELSSYYLPFTAYPYRGEVVNCPVCDSDQGTQVANLDRRLKRLTTFGCDNCGLLFTNPMPTDAELENYYTRLYRRDYQGASTTPKNKHLVKRKREAAARANLLVELLQPGSKTLDVGCGSGEFVGKMLSLGHDAFGFEPGESYGRYAKSIYGDRVRIQSWQDAEYHDKFDLVSCFHVLEHLRNPMAALQWMASMTAPGGLIYIEVPDVGAVNPSKGFGGLHFAHVIGFNHFNLLLAGALANLQPKVVVSQTGIIFEHGGGSAPEQNAEQGRGLTESLYGGNRAVEKYFRYLIGKVFSYRITSKGD